MARAKLRGHQVICSAFMEKEGICISPTRRDAEMSRVRVRRGDTKCRWASLEELKRIKNKEGALTDLFNRNPGFSL